jgi:hypothetical protein
VMFNAGAHTRLGPATWGWGINTGVVVYRNRPETSAFLEAWRQSMMSPNTRERQLDDQGSFMDVLATTSLAVREGHGIFPRDPQDENVMLAGPEGSLKVLHSSCHICHAGQALSQSSVRCLSASDIAANVTGRLLHVITHENGRSLSCKHSRSVGISP